MNNSHVHQRKNVRTTIASKYDEILDKAEEISFSKVQYSGTSELSDSNENIRAALKSFSATVSWLVGLTTMIVLAYLTVWYFQMLHENMFWFSNIKEVEREISFRTEQALYYSYYKQLVNNDNIMQGCNDLKVDNLTEHGHSINILQRFNIYQEVILAALYKVFNVKEHMLPILFYTKSVFFLQAFFASGIYLTAWSLGNSWLAGSLAICYFIAHKMDASRVDYSVPLRECFSIPFMFCQMAAVTLYLKPHLSAVKQNSLLILITLLTFLYIVTWQFAQFMSLLQVFTLYALAVIRQLPSHKVVKVMIIQEICLLAVCFLQFGNAMLFSSLAASFIPVAIASLLLQGAVWKKGLWVNLKSAMIHVSVTMFLTLIINKIIKLIVSDSSDQHIFKFILGKLGVGDPRDFESRVYLCSETFRSLDLPTFSRLSSTFLLPLYCLVVFFLLSQLVYHTLIVWNKENDSQNAESDYSALAYHTVLTVLYAILSISTMRMKCLWVPHICIIAAGGISHSVIWKSFTRNSNMSELLRRSVAVIWILYLAMKIIPFVYEQMEDLNEFWDPDTVELMEWINSNTPTTAAFAGSMQLLAGVKLCTGRPITNHPHFEDQWLRQRTVQVYQMYAKQSLEHVHRILKDVDASYIIIENGICVTSDESHCHLVDILDLHNGHLPDRGSVPLQNLMESPYPRFCYQIIDDERYARFFRFVFSNKTFRVYKVLN